ncbi:MAG: hypothetical protein AWU57_490 [Marinobacter sp. T13-3]|nr:MAG: hypothetical protein AWU57_490 [Marinobacter sp. T13-3]
MSTTRAFKAVTLAKTPEENLPAVFASQAASKLVGISALRTENVLCASEQDAAAYVKEQSANDQEALAVKVKGLSATTRARLARYEQRCARLQEKLDQLPGGALNPLSFEEQVIRQARLKQAFKGCRSCESRINTQTLTSVDCPACGEVGFLLTSGLLKRRDKIEHKRQTWTRQLAEMESKMHSAIAKNKRAPGDWYWYVGGWCETDAQS